MAEVQRMTWMTSTRTTQFVVYIYERYTPSCSSSWSRLYGESTIYQESTPDYEQPTWRSTTTLLCDKVIETTNAKTFVFADSVLCLGSISDQRVEALKLEAKMATSFSYVSSSSISLAEVQRMTWMTSTTTTQFVVYIYMNVTLQAAVHHGRDYMENLRFTKSQLLTTNSLRGDRRLFYVTKWLRLRTTRYSVWDVSVINRSKT